MPSNSPSSSSDAQHSALSDVAGNDRYPALTVTKVDRGWYTYEVHANGVHLLGQGNRAYVYQAVERALLRAAAS